MPQSGRVPWVASVKRSFFTSPRPVGGRPALFPGLRLPRCLRLAFSREQAGTSAAGFGLPVEQETISKRGQFHMQ